MSSNSFLVDLTKSLIIVNPDEFPKNLEKPTREDYPVQPFPIQPYEARNVVPTALGYRSFFNEAKQFQLTALPDLTQHAVAYQTQELETMLIALTEDGIYVCNPTVGVNADWELAVDTSAGAVVNQRRLWTYTVIANRMFLYQQGSSVFWAVVTQDRYQEAVAGPSLITGATRTPLWNKWSTGILSYTPAFLNMTGQVGLFRAGNRLGFWDSDSAVAWSSAVAIEDFTPSAQTFAGVTKFAKVQGRINMVQASGDGFIIYATKSIVMASYLPNSPERWSGESIMSEVGVAFDTQIAVAQPDQIHFCITQAGLLQISNGQPEYIAPEITDYLAANSTILTLHLIEGRYLFISTLSEFPTRISRRRRSY